MPEREDAIRKLESEIRRHDELYWGAAGPEISDAEYDLLCRRLAALDPENPLLKAIHTPEVAASGGKIVHKVPMLSLDKAYSLEEVMDWAKKYARSPEERILIQPKYDGISAVFDGRTLSTRGDGRVGDDITGKTGLIRLEDASGEHPLDRPVRGEIVLRPERFEALKKIIRSASGNGEYKNTRNVLTGFMIAKDDALRQIEYAMRRSSAFLSLVDYDGFCVEVRFDELEERWESAVEKLTGLPYPLDGIVLKIADRDYRKSLGDTEHHPRGEIAYKFSNIKARTKLLGVEWSFGKNCLTPVAILEPVEMGGVTIKRASLHNAQNIIDRDIQINDVVTVERAGDVIPYISASEPGEGRKTALIDRCPGCNSPLERKGPELCCTDPDCFETRLKKLLDAVGRIGIEQLGEPTLRGMMTRLGVRHLVDIFALEKSDLLKLDKFAERKASALAEKIKESRSLDEYQVLAALNVPHVGLAMAKKILRNHTLAELRTFEEKTLSEIDGVGPERAAALVRVFREDADFLDELLSAVKVSSAPEVPAAERKGTICFTGKMPEKRSFYQALAQKSGYETVDEVNSSLSLLVAADPAEKSAKLEKAARFHVPVMRLEEWLDSLPRDVRPAAPEEPEARQLELF